MQPSSVIFLVVIAIWAAYLVHHWVGRREHLATARTVDRFSESMRILDRTASTPDRATDSHTRATVPARLHRNEVSARRPDDLDVAAPSAADRGRRLADRVVATARGAASSESRDAAMQSARRVGGRARDLGAKAAVQGARATGSATPGKSPLFGRAPRGVLVIGAIVFTLAALLLGLLGAAGWRWTLLGVAMTAASIWWLRKAVAAEGMARRERAATRATATATYGGSARDSRRAAAPGQRAAAATRPPHAPTPRGAGTGPARTARAAGATRGPGRPNAGNRTGAVAAGEATPAAEVRHATAAADQHPVAATAASSSVIFDIEAHTPAAAVPAVPVAREVAAPGDAWSPVPVPPPTYTLKARAGYPSTPLVEDADDDVVSPFATVTDASQYAADRARTASG